MLKKEVTATRKIEFPSTGFIPRWARPLGRPIARMSKGGRLSLLAATSFVAAIGFYITTFRESNVGKRQEAIPCKATSPSNASQIEVVVGKQEPSHLSKANEQRESRTRDTESKT
jgi:hypothetical protein